MHKYTCTYCGKEFEIRTSGRKYCSHDCYICSRFNKSLEEVRQAAKGLHTDISVEDDDRPGVFVLKPRTPEEEKAYVEKFKKNNPGVMRNLYFAVTMNMGRQMFSKDIITTEDYWKIFDLMVEKYHPDPRTEFLYAEPYDMTDPEQWKKYYGKVPFRPVKRKNDSEPDTVEVASETSAPKTYTKPTDYKNKEEHHTIERNPPADDNRKLFVADEISKLKELLDCGALTQEEFDTQKKKLLNI